MSWTRAWMSHAPRRISSKRVGSKLSSLRGRPTTALSPTLYWRSPSYSQYSIPASSISTLGARSWSALGSRPSNMSGGSTRWSSTEISVKWRGRRSGSGRKVTSLGLEVAKKPGRASRSSKLMLTVGSLRWSSCDRAGAAVGHQRQAVDVPGVVGEEEADDRADVVDGVAEAAARVAAEHPRRHGGVVGEGLLHRRRRRERREAVHPDA